MTETEFQQVVAAYVNRDAESFVQGNPPVNLLRVAINNVKKWGQRNLDFELARNTVTVNVNVTSGGLLSTAQDSDGNPVVINRIEKAYLGYGNGSAYRPIKISTKRQMARRQDQAWHGMEWDLSVSQFPTSSISEPVIIRQGGKIFLTPVTNTLAANGETISIALDVVQWIEDYSDTFQSDFFLEYCQDWLMYRSVRELNFYLKDSNRVIVTSGMVDDAWEVVKVWNASLMTDDDHDLS